jgi:hypothetical protein
MGQLALAVARAVLEKPYRVKVEQEGIEHLVPYPYGRSTNITGKINSI